MNHCAFTSNGWSRSRDVRCGVVAHVKDRRPVELVDLPSFGRPTRLIGHKRRFRCPEASRPHGSWTEQDPLIAPRRLCLSDRAGRWITEQVGRRGPSVAEAAKELGCDWHTVNDALVAYGEALIDDDPSRFSLVEALGLDEVLFVREGQYHRQCFSTRIVDVERGQLLDVGPGRSGTAPTAQLNSQGLEWLARVRYATLDLSSSFKLASLTTWKDVALKAA